MRVTEQVVMAVPKYTPLSKTMVVNMVQTETGPRQKSSKAKIMDLVHSGKGSDCEQKDSVLDDKCHPHMMAPGREVNAEGRQHD